MSQVSKENIEIVKKYFTLINNKKFDQVDALVDENIVLHAKGGQSVKGKKVFRMFAEKGHASFAGLIDTIVDIFADDSGKVCARGFRQGTVKAPVMGVPAKGQKIRTDWIAIFRIEHGKIAERWINSDDLSFLQQLGALGPPPGSPGHSHGGHGHSHGGKPCHGHGSQASSSSNNSAKPVQPPSFPVRAEQVDAKWLNRVFAQNKLVQDAKVKQVKYQFLGDASASPLDESIRFTLEYDKSEPSAPNFFIAKFPTSSGMARQIFTQSETYKRSVQFLRYVAPQLNSSGFTGDEFLLPTVFHSDYAPKSDDFVLLVEDLSFRGKRGNPISGCTFAQAQMVVKALANFHAHFWCNTKAERDNTIRKYANLAQNDPAASMAWMNKMPATAFVSLKAFASSWNVFKSLSSSNMPQSVKKLGDELQRNKVSTIISKNLMSFPSTLCLNDIHMSNLFFTSKNVYLSSFQEISFGCPAKDLAYFLVQALPTNAERTSDQQKLLKLYHETLSQKMGTSSSSSSSSSSTSSFSYGYEQLVKDFKFYAPTALISTVCNGTGLLRMEKNAQQNHQEVPAEQKSLLTTYKTLLARIFVALDELN